MTHAPHNSRQDAGKAKAAKRSRLHITVRGAVQGVGFRPFVYRLATSMHLPGWVNNSPQGVFIEVEGTRSDLTTFLRRLEVEKPAVSVIQSIEPLWLESVGFSSFEIRESEQNGGRSALILPDLATCPDCLREVFDPADRRYLYPFTNCTNCGPRFSIIEALPYDRPNTTMRHFPMCEECRAEYEDPLDRRFHAQPNACPVCGPQLQLWSPGGEVIYERHDALLRAAELVRDGGILALKGLGGFLLVCDARSEEAVTRLRERKHREEKPFALMYPDLASVEAHCHLSEQEANLLKSPQSPIVLLKKRPGAWEIASQVAHNSPNLGVMLPYTPLHHILMSELSTPVVATSGNLSDEPICTSEHDALQRLAGIADLFLVHNRPIARHIDDSIVRVMAGEPTVLRRARGYAPMPVRLAEPLAGPVLAVGAHLKNSVALGVGCDVFISQHISDLETAEAYHAFRRVAADLQTLYEVEPAVVACDAHPDYLSTQYARASGVPTCSVQHHLAHVYACMAENHLQAPLLGVSWDGTGWGEDGTVWGGEFFTIEDHSAKRYAHLRTFRLPGGDRAVREPRRSALGVLYELLGERLGSRGRIPTLWACSQEEIEVWRAMMKRGTNAPRTSSAGRLFDAVASMLGVRHTCTFEGQAAMELEYAATGAGADEHYNFSLVPNYSSAYAPIVIDWSATIYELLLDLHFETPVQRIAARFHNTLAEMVVEVARRAGFRDVALTGGCFQNAYLLERAVARLREAGFTPHLHRQVPPNDGGVALGQVVASTFQAAQAYPLRSDLPASPQLSGSTHRR